MGPSNFCSEFSRLELGLSESSEPFSVSYIDTHAQSHNLKLAAKATITRCNLSPRFCCIDATLLCEFESDKI